MSLIVEILEVFSLEGWRGGFLQFHLLFSFLFSFSCFLFPLSPLYHVDVNLLLPFFGSTIGRLTHPNPDIKKR